MIITDLKPVKKSLSLVYIDGEYAMKLDTATLAENASSIPTCSWIRRITPTNTRGCPPDLSAYPRHPRWIPCCITGTTTTSTCARRRISRATTTSRPARLCMRRTPPATAPPSTPGTSNDKESLGFRSNEKRLHWTAQPFVFQ